MSIENRLTALQNKLEELYELSKAAAHKTTETEDPNLINSFILPKPYFEIRTLELWKSVVAECLGTLIYVFFVCGVSIPWTGHFPPFLSIAFATALIYGALTYQIFPGAHLNPAFSIALLVAKKISTLRCLLHITAQSGGAIAGAAILFGLTVTGYQGTLGATTIASHIEALQAFGLELLLTFVLTLTFMSNPKNCFSTSAVLLAGSLVALPCTGAGLNPVRSLGPAFVMNKWPKHWVFWLGPISGGLLASYFFQFILRRNGSYKKNKQIRHTPSDGDSLDIPATELPVSAPDRLLCERFEPIYSGTRSLYLKPSPVLPRTNLNRSQSVYASKRLEYPPKFLDSASTSKKLVTPQPHHHHQHHGGPDSNYETLYERKGGLLVSGPPSYESSYYKTYEKHNNHGHGNNFHHAREKSDASSSHHHHQHHGHRENRILAQYETSKGFVDVDPKAALHSGSNGHGHHKSSYYETNEIKLKKHISDVPESKLIDTSTGSDSGNSHGSGGNPPPPPRFRSPMQPASHETSSKYSNGDQTNDLSRMNSINKHHNSTMEHHKSAFAAQTARKPYEMLETKKLLDFSPNHPIKTNSPVHQNHYSPRLLMPDPKDSTYSRILEPILNSKPIVQMSNSSSSHPKPHHHHQPPGICSHLSPNDQLMYSFH